MATFFVPLGLGLGPTLHSDSYRACSSVNVPQLPLYELYNLQGCRQRSQTFGSPKVLFFYPPGAFSVSPVVQSSSPDQ